MSKYRPAISVVLFVLVAVCVAVCTLAVWANNTLFDSQSFSERSVRVLDSAIVRKQLATTLTEELARAGNQQAVNFRPAVQFAIEVAADTDTFRAIFRNAIRQTHQSLMEGRGSGAGIDLSDALGIIGATMQLPGSAQLGDSGGSLNSSFEEVTQKVADLGIWSLEDTTALVAIVSFVLAVALTVAGIAIAVDRREAVVRLGLALVLAGGLVLAVRWLAELTAERLIRDANLADAVSSAIDKATDDLRIAGLWIPAYGVVIAAAASHSGFTPHAVARQNAAWADRRRQTTGGTVLLAVVLLIAALAVTTAPTFWAITIVVLGGLWLAYFGVVELVGLLRRGRADAVAEVASAGAAPHERRRLLAAGAVVALVLALLTGGLVLATRRAASTARASGELRCNGDPEFCNERIDEVVFPGTHNSMSSSLYPGFLFGEQIGTIKNQLDAGVRALLIDTHYGVPTTVRVPGADTQLVVTDKATALSAPEGEDIDPAVVARAQALAARAPKAANAKRDIFLCHNFCELGAVRFSDVLADVKSFLDTNQDEIVLLIIQDETTPADTSAAIEAAGLGAQAFTLRPGEPLPTLREMIDAGQRLLVFAEQGGAGAPEWYMKAYDWFQETGFTFPNLDAFNCNPNRGNVSNPLFLVNHWVSNSPPNPSSAQQANQRGALERRLVRCLNERGRIPNVVAVDFGEKGDVVSVADELAPTLRASLGGAEDVTASTTVPTGPTTTAAPGASTTTTSVAYAPIPEFTTVTKLTGGDGTAFCVAFPSANRALEAWAVAVVAAPAGEGGLADLAFAPYLDSELAALYAVAPQELVALSSPLRQRMSLALDELKKLGLDDNQLSAMASEAHEQVTSSDSPDAITVQLQVLERLETEYGADAVRAAATRLSQAIGESLEAIDLGDVTTDAAVRAGFPCLA